MQKVTCKPKVTVTLGRKLLGVLLNVFVPTTILNLIGFSTNFYKVINLFKPSHESTLNFVEIYITCPKMFQDAYFESVIAINLTSMLVLVALFVQVKIHNSSVSGKNTNAL